MKLPFFHAKLLAPIRLNTYLCRIKTRKGIVMEDIMQFLVIAGIIAFGVYRQYAKEQAKKSENERSMPLPKSEVEAPMMSPPPPKRTVKKEKQPLPVEGVRTTHNPRSHNSSNTAAAPPTQKEEAGDSEFSIHSAEEARRAIIWSEILQRKY